MSLHEYRRLHGLLTDLLYQVEFAPARNPHISTAARAEAAQILDEQAPETPLQVLGAVVCLQSCIEKFQLSTTIY